MKTQLSLWLLAILTVACVGENESLLQSDNSSLATGPNQATTTAATASTIQFSGYTWNVKNSGTAQWGPGPNYWSGANVWVDANGWLHLKITKNANGTWNCAEVSSTQTFGNGTYQWKVEGPVNSLDKNVVLGLFNYSGRDGFDEMDIEFAKWGRAGNKPLNYTVYPGVSGSTFHVTSDFTMTGTYTTHRFARTSSSVVFKSLGGFVDNDTNLFKTATCTSPPYSISTLAMPIYMNLWLFQGKAPFNGSSVEIVIHEFKFIP
jgi:hypothetical protein